VSGQIQYGRADSATSLRTSPGGPEAGDEHRHFTTSVRFGRRKSDQVGHLVLTTAWLTFRGTVDLSVSWAEVSHVEAAGNEMIVSLHDTRRTLRFRCQTADDAQRGAVVGGHLAAIARSDPYQHA
jgi:hypothetical protein